MFAQYRKRAVIISVEVETNYCLGGKKQNCFKVNLASGETNTKKRK